MATRDNLIATYQSNPTLQSRYTQQQYLDMFGFGAQTPTLPVQHTNTNDPVKPEEGIQNSIGQHLNQGGGGGGGGYRTATCVSVTNGMTVTVGGGGTSAPGVNASCRSGNASTFGPITSAGGGGGADESSCASKNTGAGGAVFADTRIKSSTNIGDPTSDMNLFVVAAGNATKFIVDTEGQLHSDGGAQTAYDTFEDAQLVRAFDLSHGNGVINSKFDKFISYNHEKLAEMKLVGREEDGTPNHFVNVTGMQRLHNGAIWQQYEKHNQLLEAVYDLAKEAVGEKKANAILEKHEVKRLH